VKTERLIEVSLRQERTGGENIVKQRLQGAYICLEKVYKVIFHLHFEGNKTDAWLLSYDGFRACMDMLDECTKMQ